MIFSLRKLSDKKLEKKSKSLIKFDVANQLIDNDIKIMIDKERNQNESKNE